LINKETTAAIQSCIFISFCCNQTWRQWYFTIYCYYWAHKWSLDNLEKPNFELYSLCVV